MMTLVWTLEILRVATIWRLQESNCVDRLFNGDRLFLYRPFRVAITRP